MTYLPKHKLIRLDSELYAQVGRVCSVTIAVKRRMPVFSDHRLAAAAVDVLRRRSEDTGVPLYAYCVMPDHVHLVLNASPSCNIVAFVGQFKNLVLGSAWQNGLKGTFWQRSFYDHFLRSDEDLIAAVTYVLANPVRKGLVRQWTDYPFGGSLVYSRHELPA